MRKILQTLLVCLLLIPYGVQAQRHKNPFDSRAKELAFRKHTKLAKAFSAEFVFMQQYLPGEEVNFDLQLVFDDSSWDWVIESYMVVPEGVEIISVGDFDGNLTPTIISDTIKWAGTLRNTPGETELTLKFPEDASGDLIFEGWFLGDMSGEYSSTTVLPQLANEPLLIVSLPEWHAGITQVSSTIASGTDITFYNGGAEDLVISEINNLEVPFFSTFEIPATISSQTEVVVPFAYGSVNSGVHTSNLSIVSNGGSANLTLTGASYNDDFTVVDFENSNLQFPPVGWTVDAYETDNSWYSSWGALKFSTYNELDSAALYSPYIDLSNSSNLFLGFYLSISDPEISHINIEYTIDEGKNWLTLDENIVSGYSTDGYYYKSLAGVSGEKVQFNIKAVCANGNITLDNIYIPNYYNPGTVPSIVTNNLPEHNATDVSLAANISWDKVLYADGYKLYLDTLPDPVQFIDLGDTSRYYANLDQLTYYYWKVVPYNEYGEAVDCPVWRFKTEQFVPTAWTHDTDRNTQLTFIDGQKFDPVTNITSSGETFVTWFSPEEGNINVRAQLLDVDGREKFRRNGMLISKHPQNSWISGYSSVLDADDNLLISFSDIRKDGNNTHAYIYKISTDGEFLWGEDGIALTDTIDLGSYSPIIKQDTLGYTYVGVDHGYQFSVIKLDAEGNTVWSQNYLSENQVIGFEVLKNGNIYLASFHDDYQLYLDYFDTDLNPIFSESVVVSNDPMFPYYGPKTLKLVSDNSNGAYVVWQCALGWNASIKWQYVNTEGEIGLDAAGAFVSTNEARGHAYPHPIYIETEDKLLLTWDEQLSSSVGLYVQKMDKLGNLDFAETGKAVYEINDTIAGTDGVQLKGDTLVWLFSNYYEGNFYVNQLNASFFDLNLDPIEEIGTIRYSTLPNDKPLEWVSSGDEMLAMVWDEERENGSQLYAQNLYYDGNMGILGPDTVAPFATKVQVLSNEKLLITFNEQLYKESTEIDTLFTIEGAGDALVTSSELLHPTQVLLHVSGMEDGEQTLYMENMTDLQFNVNPLSSIDFTFTADSVNPEITAVKAVADNKIVIRFNEAIIEQDLVSIENYSLSGGSATISSIHAITDKQVVLHTSLLMNGTYALTINKATDLMENSITDQTVDFEYKANSGNLTYLDEDFENGMPDDWSLFNLDGATPSSYTSMFTDAWIGLVLEDGNKVVGSTSFYDPAAQADDWMVTHAIAVQKNTYLFWDAQAVAPSYPDGYQIWVSTEGNKPENFTVKVFDITEEHYEWRSRWIDLSNYGFGDDTLYVAFRNNSNDKYILLADNLELYTPFKNDAAVDNAVIPTDILAGSELSITAEVECRGVDTLKSFELNWQLNDGDIFTQTIENIELVLGESQSITHNQVVNIPVEGGNYMLKVWTSNPNGMVDDNSANDVFEVNVHVAEGFPQRLVLLEHFTNTGCAPCATYNPYLEELLDENDNREKVMHITYHAGYPDASDPYYNANPQDVDARIALYNVPGVPSVTVAGSENLVSPSAVTQQAIDQEYLKPGLLKIEGEAKYKDDVPNLSIAFDLTNLSDFNTKQPYVHAVVAQTYYRENDPAPNGEIYFPGVMRKMLPTHEGSELINLDSASVNSFSFNYEMPEDFNIEDAMIGIFIQDKTSNEVYMTGTLAFRNTTSIQSSLDEAVSIYPNPATELINITSDYLVNEITMINISGIVVEKLKSIDYRANIDVSNYQSGFYFINLNTEKGNIVYPIVVK